MELRVITLRYNQDLHGFPEDALHAAAAGREVLAVSEHFFTVGDIPHLALVLQLAGDHAAAAAAVKTKPADDPGNELPEALRDLYHDLRRWRNDTAKDSLFALAADLRAYLAERLQLMLKEERTLIAPVTEGMPFLGWRVYPGLLRQQGKRLRRQRRLLKRREAQYRAGVIDAAKVTDCARALAGPRQFLGAGEPLRGSIDV